MRLFKGLHGDSFYNFKQLLLLLCVFTDSEHIVLDQALDEAH
jgi:hypothetical protein